MRGTRTLIGALALALLAAPLAAQETPEARIRAAMDQVRAQGMPVELLESKLAEGLAKNVPMDRIAVAIQVRARAMERANAALQRVQDRPPPAAELAVGADAIEVGVGEAVLEALARRAGPERRTVAIAALAYLVSEGHVPAVALARVQEALAQGGQGLGHLKRMSRPEHPHGGPPRGVPPAGRPGGTGKPEGTPGKGPPDKSGG
jgi:hypothetical protein